MNFRLRLLADIHLLPLLDECSAPRSAPRYDPLTHSYPDPEHLEAQRPRDLQRSNGRAEGVGIAIRVDPVRASFNPILGECREQPAAAEAEAAAVRRPMSAPRSGGGPPAERPVTPGRRNRVVQGDSWGTYNPISHQWHAPPSDTRFHDQNEMVNKQGHNVRGKVEDRPQKQGVYNPILNTWVVPPSNPRLIQGLSFAPAKLFSQPHPSQPRT